MIGHIDKITPPINIYCISSNDFCVKKSTIIAQNSASINYFLSPDGGEMESVEKFWPKMIFNSKFTILNVFPVRRTLFGLEESLKEIQYTSSWNLKMCQTALQKNTKNKESIMKF